ARRDKSVEQVLRQRPVDLLGANRRALPAVKPWVVDVDVEPVLVRDVLGPEVAAVRTTEIADPYPRRVRMSTHVAGHDVQHDPDEPVVAVAAPRAIGRAVQDRIPGEECRSLGRKADAADDGAAGGPP